MDQKTQKLSNLVVAPQQHLILVLDETGREKVAQRIFRQFLAEQSQDEGILKTLQLNERLKNPATLARFLVDCTSHGQKGKKPLNVVLPTLADLLCYQPASVIFEFLHELRHCEGIQRCMIWASTQHLMFPKAEYLLAACEYICDTKLHLVDEQNISFTARKPGGGITHKSLKYKIDKNEFLIQTNGGGAGDSENSQQSTNPNINQSTQSSAEPSSTFKIELEEEELVARNAMKLPYEKTSEVDASGGGGNIVYTPDASDDFDDEDPDEDLCI